MEQFFCKTMNIFPFSQAFSGRDASQAFLTYHRRQFPHKRAEKAFIGKDDEVDHDLVDHEDFLELCSRIEKVLPRWRSFAPWSYFVKVAVILGLAFGLEIYMHLTATYVWYLSAILGLVYALIGINKIFWFCEKIVTDFHEFSMQV